MQPTIKSHIEFCKAVSDGSTYKDAYKTYVSRKVNVSEAVCEKDGSLLGKKYAIYIQELKQKTSIAIDKAYENEAVKDALKSVMCKVERMQILTQIARGEIPLTKPMVVDKIIEEVDVVPDWMDRKNAIAELNKMDGSYSPIKVADTDIDGKDKPVYTTYVIDTIGEVKLKS